jgi:epsin
LLEFLIKNGSERVIDDARSHVHLLKMLRQFHFIDQNGKDQGINVRNRAKELAELLSDVEKIRTERKKSRQTRNKYGGVEGGAGMSGGFSSSGSSSRYGGYGLDNSGYGGYSGGVYGDGGGFGGQEQEYQESASSSTRRRDKFDEYDEYDDGASRPAASTTTKSSTKQTSSATKAGPPKSKKPVEDLFSFDDDSVSAPAVQTSKPAVPSAAAALADDDDFDDFQSATVPAPQVQPIQALSAAPARLPTTFGAPATNFAAPKPVSGPQAANLSDLVAFSSISPAPGQSTTASSAFASPALQSQSSGYSQSNLSTTQPNYFTSVPAARPVQAGAPLASGLSSFLSPQQTPLSTTSNAAKPNTSAAFGSLWNSASAGVKKPDTPKNAPKLASLAKEKASAGIWGSGPASQSSSGQQGSQRPAASNGGQPLGNGLDDLLG